MRNHSVETAWDVVVIGGGHAGCEAAHASAKMGRRTLLLTLNPDRIGFMSCNPAIGGLAKGQLVKEIDALGGLMGRITDQAAIQYRRLNSSKGPAVRSSRAQCDKAIYSLRMRETLRDVKNLTVSAGEASRVKTRGGRVVGLELSDGSTLECKSVVITSGTFLSAIMHTGEETSIGGRVGDAASLGLSSSLSDLGFRLRRLKTGTPPRLSRKSIDFSKTTEQPGDEIPVAFSFFLKPERFPILPQVSCFITYTNSETHDVIAQNLYRSPMYTGAITGVGPRYCPSIEDKVKRFADKDRHQVFIEPEGLDTDEMYINGISTSLPRETQEAFVRSIQGLENAVFLKYGYAVEYDAVDARQLKRSLESKDVRGLFLAGQVNGTSGYEEAGAQGLIAGINAALSCEDKGEFVLGRSDGYVGVLIDDLTLKGSDEPYRMFTSRAEYRLLLREDNADLRLSEKGHGVGLLGSADFAAFEKKRKDIESWKARLKESFVLPSTTAAFFEQKGQPPLKDRLSMEGLLKRPEMTWGDLVTLGLSEASAVAADVAEQVSIQVKYEGYIQRDFDTMEGVLKNEALALPTDLDYEKVPGLSIEVKNLLRQTRPETLGQAGRVSGITPAAVANLMIYLKMQETARKSRSPSRLNEETSTGVAYEL